MSRTVPILFRCGTIASSAGVSLRRCRTRSLKSLAAACSLLPVSSVGLDSAVSATHASPPSLSASKRDLHMRSMNPRSLANRSLFDSILPKRSKNFMLASPSDCSSTPYIRLRKSSRCSVSSKAKRVSQDSFGRTLLASAATLSEYVTSASRYAEPRVRLAPPVFQFYDKFHEVSPRLDLFCPSVPIDAR